ncbi:hypothetical protein HKD37_17G048129 [Glycine soja]
MLNTTFSKNQNTNQERNFAAKKPIEFTLIPVSYDDLLPYPLDNSMVAITPARFPTSNVQSFEFGMIGPLDESISCFLIRVDPWVLVPITFRGLHVLAIRRLHVLAIRGLHALTFRGLHVLTFKGLHALTFRGLHVLTIRGLHALTFRGLRILTFRGLHICALRQFKFLGYPLILEGDQLCEHNQKGRLSRSYYACQGKISLVPLQRNECGDHAHETPSGPGEFQQGPGVSSCGYGPLSILQGVAPPRHPVDSEEPNRALGFPALVTGLWITPARHSVDPEKSNRVLGFPALIMGLCQFYGVPVTPSKVIKPSTNRAFIKKYCAPRQAQGETPQQPGVGRQQATDTPPPPPKPLSSSTKTGALPTTCGRPAGDQVQSQR